MSSDEQPALSQLQGSCMLGYRLGFLPVLHSHPQALPGGCSSTSVLQGAGTLHDRAMCTT